MMRRKVAVIGAGHLGRIHARLAQAGGLLELVAVCDPILAAREGLAQETGVHACEDYRSLRGRVDAAIVATPTSNHADIVVNLLNCGIHTFVEKPLAASVDEAVAMVDAARHSGAVLQVGHVERFNPAWCSLGPEWNDAHYYEANRASSYSFRSTDIGVVHDLMIHDLDLILSKCTAPITRVAATLINVIGPHEDVAHARLEFADGRVALLRASRVSSHAERTLQLFATLGHALIDFSAPSTILFGRGEMIASGALANRTLTPAEREILQRELFQETLPKKVLALEKGNAIADEQRDFAQAIQAGREPIVSGAAGLRAMQVAEQILRAGARPEIHPLARPHSVPLRDRRRAG